MHTRFYLIQEAKPGGAKFESLEASFNNNAKQSFSYCWVDYLRPKTETNINMDHYIMYAVETNNNHG